MHFNAEDISARKLVNVQREVGCIINATNPVHALVLDRMEVNVCSA